jgi:hypothetical protein
MLVGRFHVSQDLERMAYSSVKQYSNECAAFLTLYQAGGLHLQFGPRVPTALPA